MLFKQRSDLLVYDCLVELRFRLLLGLDSALKGLFFADIATEGCNGNPII